MNVETNNENGTLTSTKIDNIEGLGQVKADGEAYISVNVTCAPFLKWGGEHYSAVQVGPTVEII